jgi:hypothetical protein
VSVSFSGGVETDSAGLTKFTEAFTFVDCTINRFGVLVHVRLLAVALTVMSALGPGAEMASAQDVRAVYAPLAFHAEAGDLRTTACLQLAERVYPTTVWWENAPGPAGGPERAFRSVIAAIKQKDRAALLKLTDPAQARDTARFDRQADAFFEQFQSIQLLAVPRAYEFDGLVAFLGKFQSTRQTAFVPLVLAYEGEDTFGFLPSRTNQATFRLVTDWFAPTGSAPADSPAYCADADVKRATHRVSLVPSHWRPSALLLTGALLDAPGPLATVATQVKATMDRMKAALRAGDINAVVSNMTPEGGSRLKQWFATAPQSERERYTTAFVGQQPFFVFDESPLLIVYARTAPSDVQVLYFTVAPDKRLLWTNSSFLTTSDQVFKQGPLLAAAGSPKPFSGLAIK